LEYCSRLFRASTALIDDYTKAEIEAGLQSGVIQALYDLYEPEVAWEMRESCIRDMVFLYKGLFSSIELSMCFMWWDVMPMTRGCSGEIGFEENCVHAMMLAVMEQAIYIESRLCCESVLHGLGHFHAKGVST
jgi:hypothetical protein